MSGIISFIILEVILFALVCTFKQNEKVDNDESDEVQERSISLDSSPTQQEKSNKNQHVDDNNGATSKNDSLLNQSEKTPPEYNDATFTSSIDNRIKLQVRHISEAIIELTPQEKEKVFDEKVIALSDEMTKISAGKLKVVNRLEFDRLIQVRGRQRPIAVFVPTKSESLSVSGVFIYDTTRLPDNSLYLFAGPETSDDLIKLGEKLLEIMLTHHTSARPVRIIRDMECDDFNHLIKQIGGTKTNIQSTKNNGDELVFELQFFKTLLQVTVFEKGEHESYHLKNPTMSSLPPHGAAVIDMSDRALYFWISTYNDPTPAEEADVQAGLKWMNEQAEFENREITVFTQDFIPPNVAIIFKA